MLTYSGILVLPDNDNAPSLLDIGISLGRHPRFTGGTNRYWPVLLHSLVCTRIATVISPNFCVVPATLHALLHDAHEAVTCDVPSTWKTELLREQQAKLDRQIYRSLGIRLPTSQEQRIVREVDEMAFMAEAYLYGPTHMMDWITKITPQQVISSLSLKAATEVGLQYPTAEHCDGPDALAVKDFIDLATYLISKVGP